MIDAKLKKEEIWAHNVKFQALLINCHLRKHFHRRDCETPKFSQLATDQKWFRLQFTESYFCVMHEQFRVKYFWNGIQNI